MNYSNEGQLCHANTEAFARQLKTVWQNIAVVCAPETKLVFWFGAIHDRKVDALALIERSLYESGWEIREIQSAGSAARGKRQALHFSQAEQKGAI